VTVALAFRVATYLLAAEGLLALYLTGLVGVGGAVVAGGAIAVSWWRDRLPIPALPRLRQLTVLVVAGGSAIDLLYLATSLLDGFVRLLLALLLYRLFTRRSLRDARDVGFLAFFMLVAASSVAFDVAFLGVFLVFLVVGVWTFMLHHVLSEAERVGGLAPAAVMERGRLAPPLLGLSLAAAAATLAVTAVFFFLIPRVGQAALPLRARLGAMVSGFSDHVDLGAFGEIERDPSVVMRVRFPEGPPAPESLPNLRWRGIAFDYFDGRGWKALRPRRATLTGSAGGVFELTHYRGRGPFVAQEIYLEPIGTDVVFAAPRLLAVGLTAPSITADDMEGVTVATPAARLRYIAYSELEPVLPGGREAEPPPPLDREALDRYRQLPPLSPRIEALARAVSAGSGTPYEAAARLTRFLARTYRYTLALSRQTELEPIEEFLFVRRSGNCEYFASALAVMLRTLGIPARLVNGFQRGEWNPYGRYFMIRQRDAHSWVEVHLHGVGWTTFDPSPRVLSDASGLDRVGLYLDALRLRWYRYIVNWSLHDQVTVAAALQRQTTAWRERLLTATPPGALGRLGPARAAALGALLVVGLVLWRRGAARAARPRALVPWFYARALRALARRGLRPGPGETAREFLARVSAAAPAWARPLSDVTVDYERARFGGAPPSRSDLAALERCLAQLEEPPRR
jgi:protein-glutamine gamma-glutamyltransferase